LKNIRAFTRLNTVKGHLTSTPKLSTSFFQINEYVKQAILENKPVVALESTIITHGMEYPTNMTTALAVEQNIIDQGAIPATIGIINGIIHVGITNEQIEYLAKNKSSCRKCSRRDLGFIVANKGNGSTTVAATMYIAYMAGIKIFVTGGIGGVHRGVAKTMDISADLTELSRTPVTVISAGIKSILDVPNTLEMLETLGVPVVGYNTDYVPDFFFSSSKIKAPIRLDTAKECANLIKATNDLKLSNGLLVTVPIPEEDTENVDKIRNAIDQGLREVEEQNIIGAEITPFLLKRVNELSEGYSSKSNIELIKNNATVGAKIAVEL
jgi:pseudouridine-5'-phosphate glycosidase